MIDTLVLNKKEINDFALERNTLLKKAKYNWAIFVDSDEILSKELKTDLETIDTKNTKFEAFYVYRKNFFINQYIGKEKIIRVVRKESGKWERAVHETFKVKKGLKVGILKGFIVHNTASSLRSYLAKINYYSDLHAEANKKEGKKSNLFKIFIYPTAKFIGTYIKSKNVVFSIMQSFHSFLSWSKLFFLQS